MSSLIGLWLLLADAAPVEVWTPPPPGAIQLRHGSFVSSLVFLRDGRTLLTASGDRLIRMWDPVTGKERGRLEGHGQAVLSLALAPDGNTLASGGTDGMVRLWDLAARKSVRLLEGHRGDVISLAFSPRGDWLASASTGTRGEYLVVRGAAWPFT
jgi:WD40 repeat protein